MNDLLADDDRLIPKRDIYTVSRLNSEVRALLEGGFPLLWLEGEISNLARPSSGHWYFSLKDSKAQVRCAMFRNRNQLLRFKPIDGNHVLVRARVSLYEGRGEFQLLIEHMEEAGDGALLRAFEELKQRLAQEGLFDETHKKPLPGLPACIGIVTSPTGAAIRDIVSVLQRRFPAIRIIIYPVAVQGGGASAEIARAIRIADERQECDVLIVGRGGGSLEDLWAFNEEPVARAIYDCSLPIITGIGHETDFTIADFVADQRAPTPSAAAELVSPNQDEIFNQIVSYRKYLFDLIERIKRNKQQNLEHVRTRLQQQHPQRRLEQLALRVDELEHRLYRGWEALLHHRQFRLSSLHQSLQLHNPAQRLKQLNTNLEKTRLRLDQGITLRLRGAITRLAEASRALNAYSPLATLDRGYALITQEGSLVKSIAQVSPGDRITARLSDGSMKCRIETLSANDDPRQERDKT